MMKVTCCLFTCMEKELEKTFATLMKNYLVMMIMIIETRGHNLPYVCPYVREGALFVIILS